MRDLSCFNDIRISIGQTLTSKSLQTIPLDKYVRGILYGWKEDTMDKIFSIRNADTKKCKDDIKKISPYVVWQGEFEVRNNASLIQASNLVYLDFDKKDIEEFNTKNKTTYNVQQFKEFLINLDFGKHFLFCGLSCSAQGLFAIVKADYDLDIDKYRNLHLAIQEHLFFVHGIKIDKTSDIARANIITYDEQLYINENAIAIHENEYDFSNLVLESINNIDSNEYPDKHKKKIIEDILCFATNNKISLTPTYNDLILIGFALFNDFSEFVATKLFHAFASLDKRYNVNQINQIANSIAKNNRRKVSFKTIIFLAKQNGYEMSKDLIKKNDKNDKIPIALVFSQWYDIKGYYIKEYIPGNRKFHCKRNDENYCKELTSDYMQQIMMDFTEEMNRTININAFLTYAYIEKKIQKIHVLDEYFKNLEFDAENGSEIEKLYNLFNLVDYNKSNDFFSFCSFFIGGVANVMKHHKKFHKPKYCQIFTLVSEQGFGKTTFFDYICPEPFKEFNYTKDFGKFGEKDDMEQLKNCFIILDDEGNTQTNKSSSNIKAITSKTKVNYRRPYERLSEDFDVVAIFGLCTNNHDFLKDTTGNRRYNIYELATKLNFEELNKINVDRLWAEAKYRYEQGERYWYTQDEIQEFNKANEKYMVKDFIEYLIPLAISTHDLDEKNSEHWHSYAEIIQHLKNTFANTTSLNNINASKIKYYFKNFKKKIFRNNNSTLQKLHCRLLSFDELSMEKLKYTTEDNLLENEKTTYTLSSLDKECPF